MPPLPQYSSTLAYSIAGQAHHSRGAIRPELLFLGRRVRLFWTVSLLLDNRAQDRPVRFPPRRRRYRSPAGHFTLIAILLVDGQGQGPRSGVEPEGWR